jgi:hypothetical protein
MRIPPKPDTKTTASGILYGRLRVRTIAHIPPVLEELLYLLEGSFADQPHHWTTAIPAGEGVTEKATGDEAEATQ